MKEGWTYKRFDEIMTPAKVERCGNREDLPILSITMHGGIVEQNDRFKKTIASVDKTNYKVVKDGQLVIAFPIDEGLLYTQDVANEGIMSPAYNIWDVDYSLIDRRFLVTYFHSAFAFAYYRAKLRGSTQRRRSMDKDDLLSMPIPVPSLIVQKGIVEELDLLKDVIIKQKAQIEELDKLAMSTFYDMFGDPNMNTRHFELKTLNKVCLLKAGKAIKAEELSESSEGLYPCFGGNGVRGYINRYSYEGTYPIIGRQGALCGNVNLASGRFYATEHAVVVSPLIDMNPLWLYYVLLCMRLGQYAHGVAQPGLSVKDLNPLSLMLPPLDLQQEFASKIEAIEQMKAKVRQSLKESEELFNSRMDYYFN